MTEQEVKERIRREYPPGTKFYPVDTAGQLNKEKVCTVMKSWRLIVSCDNAYFINSASNYSHAEYIYYEGHWAHIIQQEQQPAPKLIPVTKYVKGLRVQRGPNWGWFNQDGGPGKLGTVVDKGTTGVFVKWDYINDGPYFYRISGGKYELALANPADAHLLEENPLSEFHNPDKLTPEQVGEGYRLLYPSEIKSSSNSRHLYKSIHQWDNRREYWNTTSWAGAISSKTYRVPACFPKNFTEAYIKDYEAGRFTEGESSKMEDLLEEAKRRYPIGTNYTPLSCSGIPFSNSYKTKYKAKHWTNGKDVGIDCGEGLVYFNGKWAEILSTPKVVNEHPSKEEVAAMFPVGTIFRPVYYDGIRTVQPTWKIHKNNEGIYYGDTPIGSYNGYLYVFSKKKYATIVSKPEAKDALAESLTEEQMIAKLTEMYPVGTVFKPASTADHDYSPVTVGENWKVRKTTGGYDFQGHGKIMKHIGYIYTDNGVYAEIVSKSEVTPVKASTPEVGSSAEVHDIPERGHIVCTDSRIVELIAKLKQSREETHYSRTNYTSKKRATQFLAWDANSYWFCNDTSMPYFPKSDVSTPIPPSKYKAAEKEYTAEELGQQSEAVIKAYLKRRYPVGTTFIPVGAITYDEKYIITENHKLFVDTDTKRAWFPSGHKGYLWSKDDGFAEIVSTPEAPAETYNGFVVGKIYRHTTGELAYFCGINKHNDRIFELIDYKGTSINPPKNWVSKGNNTYWGYKGLETSFDPTPVEYPTTNTHNTVQAKPSGLVLENPTIIISTQNEKITSRGSISFEQRSSREGIFLPRVNLEIRKGDPVRGTGFESTAVEVSIGDRHRH